MFYNHIEGGGSQSNFCFFFLALHCSNREIFLKNICSNNITQTTGPDMRSSFFVYILFTFYHKIIFSSWKSIDDRSRRKWVGLRLLKTLSIIICIFCSYCVLFILRQSTNQLFDICCLAKYFTDLNKICMSRILNPLLQKIFMIIIH